MNSSKKTLVLVSTSALAAGAAQGAILYQPINITIGGDGHATLDLNQDSAPDFMIFGGELKPYIDNSPASASAFVLSDGTDQGLPLTLAGTMIDGGYQSGQLEGYFNQKTVGSSGVVVGDWTAAGDNEGYVGLEVVEGDGTHFGWAHFIYNSTNKVPNVNATGTLRLIDAAIETQPYTGILAGQTAETGEPVVSVLPSSQSGYPGGTAQLTVIAQGYPAPSFQWQAGAIGGGVYTNLPNGTGETHGALNTLTLQNLTLANMADYVVVVSNSSGSVTSSVPATLTVLPTTDYPAILTHRYSFQDTPGSGTFADSVGGSAWDGSLQGTAALNGSSLVLDGSSGCYASLPSYLISGYNQITVEFWADIGPGNPVWAYIFVFGEEVAGVKSSGIDYCPYATGDWQNADLRGTGGNVFANYNAGLLGANNQHITVIADPTNGVFCFYNGTNLVSHINYDLSKTVPPLADINDVENWIGKSFYPIDPYFAGAIHEFRVYQGVLPVQAIALNDAVGPDQYIELSANPTLSASLSGGNIVLSWPASNYGFSVQSTSDLSPGGSWTTLPDMPTLVGTNWQVSISAEGAPQFFQLVH